jgi:hypothetical protein
VLVTSLREKLFVTLTEGLGRRAESGAFMLKAWRRTILVALAGGGIIAAQAAAVAPAQAAGPAITIAASSKIGPVTGYVVVAYHDGKDASARIHGTITGATAGEIATLYAQSFPYAKAPAPVTSATLGAANPAGFSFTVTPTLATRYTVKLFASKTAARPLATSPVQNVYVTTSGTQTGNPLCGTPPTCHATFHVFVTVPSSALRVEMSKHFYAYFAIKYGPPGGPSPSAPEWLYLNSGHPSVSSAQRISADKFERTVTFSFAFGANASANWAWGVCVKDTLSKDGLGLPGHHGCGSSRVMRTAAYLG